MADKTYEQEMAELTGSAVPEKTEVVESAKPETDAAPVETKTETAAPVAISPESDTFDINTLPPAAKSLWEANQKRLAEIDERNQKLDRENRSFRSKTPHLEAKAARLENELRALARERALPQRVRDESPGAAQTRGKPASALQSLPGWPKLREIFREDAAPIEEAFSALETHNQDLAKRLEQSDARMAKMEELLEKDVTPRIKTIDDLRAEREEMHYRAVEKEVYDARDSLAKNYPDWHTHIEHTYDPETNEITETKVSDAMRNWLGSQPEYVQNVLFEGGPKEVEWAMSLFYATLPKPQTPNPAQQVQQSRQEQLDRRAVTGNNGSGVGTVDTSKLSPQERYALDMQRLTA